MRKIALLDIDNTTYEGLLILPLAKHQYEAGVIDQLCLETLRKDVELYKSQKVDYETTIANLLDHWALGLKNQQYRKVLEITENFLSGKGNKFYPYLKPILESLNKTYDTYFVTGEPKFVGEAVERIFPCAGYLSSEFELTENKTFDGNVKIYLSQKEDKAKAIKKLLETHDKTGSIAFGDSVSDIQMLESVENAFCVNPSKELEKSAKQNGWNIVSPNGIVDIIERI